MVRIFLYAYAPDVFGLAGYSMQVLHNGALMPVEGETVAGVPEQTRLSPSPYSRFTNLNSIFVVSQAGEWQVQIVDRDGKAVGPAARFELSAAESTRELYVRYRRR